MASKTNVPRKTTKPKTQHHMLHRLRIWLLWIIISLALLGLVAWLAFQLSPWPNALLIRQAFTKGAHMMSNKLEKYVPAGIAQIENQQYRPSDNDARLDVFYPEKTTKLLPTIVWVHGGGWVSGNKDNVDNYMKILAARGFTTVSVNYTIAPEKQYPTPIIQVNDALGYLQKHAKRLNVDDTRIVMAGDSAGSQIVAQMANIITSTAYANEMNIQAQLPANKLRGLLLNCGAYDLNLPDYNGEFGGFLRTVLWAYSGTKDFLHDPKLKTASMINYVTPKFPPSFITAGNDDPLLSQSTELNKKLSGLGVPTEPLFYPPNHKPALNHEYQFDLDTAEGRQALSTMTAFAHKYTQ